MYCCLFLTHTNRSWIYGVRHVVHSFVTRVGHVIAECNAAFFFFFFSLGVVDPQHQLNSSYKVQLLSEL